MNRHNPWVTTLLAALLFLRCATGPLGVTDIDIPLKPLAAAGVNPFPNGYLDWMDHGGGFVMVTLLAKNIPALTPPAKYVVWRYSDTLWLPQNVGTLNVNPVNGNATGFLSSYPEWTVGDVLLTTQEDSGNVSFPSKDTLALGSYARAPVIPLRFPGFEGSFPWKAALAKGTVTIDPVEGEITLQAEGLPKLAQGFVYSAWTASEEGFALGGLVPDSAGSLQQVWEAGETAGLEEALEHLALFKISIRPTRGRADTASCLTLLSGTAGDFKEAGPSDAAPGGGGHVH